ncbi:MAG: hypothetical protein JW734_04490 [Candidatus Omnitrophica bacterium]|nr:hypothetical protein [Candidatus Omnitrophota bacterium]
MKTVFLLTALILLFSGCATMKPASYYPEGKFPPTNPQDVLIIHSTPAREHIVIGEVTVSSASYNEKTLKEKVAQAGGDAVIINLKDANARIIQPGSKEVVVDSTGKTIIYQKPQIQALTDSRICGKIIKFLD